MLIVAADIGGTKTHLVLFEGSYPKNVIKEKKYESQKYSSLEEILLDFLIGYDLVAVACLAIAGPVEGGICRATNLPWIVSKKAVEQKTAISRVFLINDLEANAWGIAMLKSDELLLINKGNTLLQGNRALIAAGTGLGEAGLFWDGVQHHPFACEGGHCDFAPIDDEQILLLQYLKKKQEHVSYERVLSGPGIVALYSFFVEDRGLQPSDQVAQSLTKDNPAKVITNAALARSCPLCMRVIELFVYLYGLEAGNLALKIFALGGLYIGGGIAPKIATYIQEGRFMEGFTAKGRLGKVLASVPVYLIMNENTALLGAVRYATQKR
jgi:glucokinase